MFFTKNKVVGFPKEILINENKYLIEIIFSKKKNSSVSVKQNKLIFRMSSYLSLKMRKVHFEELLSKIVLKLKNSSIKKSNILTLDTVLKRGYFDFANERYFILEVDSQRGSFSKNVFKIPKKSNLEKVEKFIIKSLIKKYTPRLKAYLENYNLNTYNYDIKSFELKCLNSKWGHCTGDNKIMLNLKLLNASKDILDYVIVHELSHIKVKNHSSKFWLEVQKYCFDYKILRKKLRENPPGVYN